MLPETICNSRDLADQRLTQMRRIYLLTGWHSGKVFDPRSWGRKFKARQGLIHFFRTNVPDSTLAIGILI